jgi:hypothetical protein
MSSERPLPIDAMIPRDESAATAADSRGAASHDVPDQFKSYAANRDFFIREAPEIVRSGDLKSGIMPVWRKLNEGIREPYNELSGLEDFTTTVLKITTEYDSEARTLLRSAADSLVRYKDVDYLSWSHSVCHLIETYHGPRKDPGGSKRKRGDYSSPSFLDTDEAREILKVLVDESVARQKLSPNDAGCSDRIVKPIILYNLVSAGKDGLRQNYAFKPESLNDRAYANILSSRLKENGADLGAFLETNTPLEYYERMLRDGIDMPSRFDPTTQLELLQTLEKELSHDAVDAYVQKKFAPNGQKTTFEEMVRNYAEYKDAKAELRGWFVDVEGTLIVKNYEGATELNGYLVERMEKAASGGSPVTVFTGGDPVKMTEALARLGFPSKFLPVVSKSDYRGKVLEVLIDDTPPEYQGFKAADYQSR